MRVFHGSPCVVEVPDLARCRPRSDYGRAFYCTFEKELAMEWACEDPETGGYLNAYEVDLSSLSVLDLDEDDNGALAWIAVLLEHRPIDREWNVARDVERFVRSYRVDVEGHDVVAGYRADDSYFSIARAFASGAITDAQMAQALKLGGLGRQVAFRTERALGALSFLGAERVDARVWGARRLRRDREARRAFAEIRAQGPADGKRIYELGVSDDGKS